MKDTHTELWANFHQVMVVAKAKCGFFRPSHLVNGVDVLLSNTGSQGEDGKLLTFDPLRLQAVLPLFDNTGLGIGVVWNPEGRTTQESSGIPLPSAL